VYAYVRRRGYDVETARDLTQTFFTKLLEKNGLATADQTRGRFRSFLLTSMKNFLASEWRKRASLERAGDVEAVPVDYEDAENRYRIEPADLLTPEAIYERRWTLSLLERAVSDVGQSYADRVQRALFDALKGHLGSSPGAVPYRQLSEQLTWNEPALRPALSRFRARWRKRLRQLVAQTVQDSQTVDDELDYLVKAPATRHGVRRRGDAATGHVRRPFYPHAGSCGGAAHL